MKVKSNDQMMKSHKVEHDKDRGRRLLSFIQSTIGGKISHPIIRPNIRRKTIDDSTISSVEEMIKRMKLANNDVEMSMSDIRPYLLNHAKELTEQDFFRIADAFCESALTYMNIHFIVELCIILIPFVAFQNAMSAKLYELVSCYILNWEKKLDTIPSFLANLLIAKWPRPYNKAIEESNEILAASMTSVMGWIVAINEALDRSHQDRFEDDQINSLDDNANSPENLDIIFRCGIALCELCNSGQRGLWMSHPTLLDDIFKAIKRLIICELPLTRSLKQSLLQVYVSIFKWSTAKSMKMVSASTQTLTKPF